MEQSWWFPGLDAPSVDRLPTAVRRLGRISSGEPVVLRSLIRKYKSHRKGFQCTMGVEREVDLNQSETVRLVELALQRNDRIYEYTKSGGNFEAVGRTLWNLLSDPRTGVVGTILDIEVEPSEDRSGSIVTVGIEFSRRGRTWGIGSDLVYGMDGGLRQSFFAELDYTLEQHRKSPDTELDVESHRSSRKYTTKLGSRHLELFLLIYLVLPISYVIFLIPVSVVTGAWDGEASLLVAIPPLVLSVLVTWGLKRLMNL